MRRVSILTALIVPLLIACNRQLIEPSSESTGSIRISLDASERVDLISVKSDADASVPDKGDFWIEIFNSQKVKFFKEKYADVAGQTIGMNIGDFTLVARHGDSLGVGFDKPFYMAKTAFKVEPEKENLIKAVAKLANVKFAVSYNEHIQAGYSDYYAVIEHVDYPGKSLTFTKDETRSGYMPKGKVTLTVYAELDGELKCHTPKDGNGDPRVFTFEPNDFVTFNIRAGEVKGDLTFNILIDDGVELREQSIEVPADAVSNTKPSIVLSSCDENGIYYITEGVQGAPSDLGFTYKAYAGIKNCTLAIESEYLAGLGVPQTVDVKNLDASSRSSLENLGFFFAETANVGVVGFEDIIAEYSKNAVYQGGGKPTDVMDMTLSVEDNDGNTVSRTIKVQVKPDGAASIILNDYDVWANKVVDPVVKVTKGNTSLMMVESSLDGNNWSDYMQVTSSDFHMGTITGLTPSTKYYLRVVYDDWMVVSDVLSFTTESASQLVNAGFEEWSGYDWNFNHGGSLGGQSSPMAYHKPYSSGSSDIWWDTNTTVTLMSSLTMGYTYFKCYPLVQYSTDAHSGSRSAQLTCANVGNSNSTWATTGDWRVGELFLGKGNDANNLGDFTRTSDGHSFASRPSSVTFWYEYAPYSSSDVFLAEAAVLAADGTVIATGSVSRGTQAEWTSVTLPLNYTVTNKKAATLRLSFKASASSSHSCDNGGHYLEIAGQKNEGDKYRIKLSATLRIDDVQLNY